MTIKYTISLRHYQPLGKIAKARASILSMNICNLEGKPKTG